MVIKTYTSAKMKKMKDKTDWNRLENITEDDIDYSDIPIPTDDMIAKAVRYKNGDLLKKLSKKQVVLSLDSDVITKYQSLGDNWQNVINDILLEASKNINVQPLI